MRTKVTVLLDDLTARRLRAYCGWTGRDLGVVVSTALSGLLGDVEVRGCDLVDVDEPPVIAVDRAPEERYRVHG